jgi:hypothetical protein
MVQWTEKPAVKPQAAQVAASQAAAPKPEDPPVVVQRTVRKARKSRMAGVMQALTVCAFFGLIIGFFLYREMPSGTAKAPAPQETVQERAAAAGRIVVMDRAECREFGFDNQSGRTVHKGQVSCHETPTYNGSATQSLYRHPTNRLDSIRRSFAQ